MSYTCQIILYLQYFQGLMLLNAYAYEYSYFKVLLHGHDFLE